MSGTHYIYLLQTRESIRTNENVYKVGKTKQPNLKRLSQYPKGSTLLLQTVCRDCDTAENDILGVFKTKFTQRKEYGNEYFQGNYKEMINIIYEITTKQDSVNKSPIDKLRILETQLYNGIAEIFPMYTKDESFGGNKKFIKILEGTYDTNNRKSEDPGALKNYEILYINPHFSTDVKRYYKFYKDTADLLTSEAFNTYIIHRHQINNVNEYGLQYFTSLLSGTLKVNKVYNINSGRFADILNNTKIRFNIEEYNLFKQSLLKEQDADVLEQQSSGLRHTLLGLQYPHICIHCIRMVDYVTINGKVCLRYEHDGKTVLDSETSILTKPRCNVDVRIKHLLYNNVLISDVFYCTLMCTAKQFSELRDYTSFRVDFGLYDLLTVELIRIQNSYYHIQSFWLKHAPHFMKATSDNDYYLYNRHYELIQSNKQIALPDLGERIYLTKRPFPWESYAGHQYLVKLFTKNKQLLRLRNCLNPNPITEKILSMVKY